MTVHKLKTWSEYFHPLMLGRKTFEVRKNDRHFKTNDILILLEYVPENNSYTGLYVIRQVGYILDGGQFGLSADVCVMSLLQLECQNCRCGEFVYSKITENISCANCGDVIDQ